MYYIHYAIVDKITSKRSGEIINDQEKALTFSIIYLYTLLKLISTITHTDVCLFIIIQIDLLLQTKIDNYNFIENVKVLVGIYQYFKTKLFNISNKLK